MSSERSTLTAIFVLFLILILNLAILDFKVMTLPNQGSPAPTEIPLNLPSSAPIASVSSKCSSECQSYIDLKLISLKAELLKTLSNSNSPIIIPPQLQPSPVSVASSSAPAPKEIYIYFGANGSSQATSWADVPSSQIKFDTSNYPGAKAFYYDVNIQSDAPDRTAYSRIFDSTHGVGVVNSDVNYTGLASTIKESSALSLSSGALTLNIQVHSLNGNFAIVNNPRIRITY